MLNFSFACHEQPMICFLTFDCVDKRLGSKPQEGEVYITDNRKSWELWCILPLSDGESVIKSHNHGHFLVPNKDGSVTTSKISPEKGKNWAIQPSFFKPGKFVVKSVHDNRKLCCDDDGCVHVAHEIDANLNIEIQTGELCFLSSPTCNKRLKCEPNGKLSLTDNWQGWEVWRMIEVGDGTVLISSWTHSANFLCSDLNGNVFTTKNRCETWRVEKGANGVIFKSASFDRYLSANNERRLHTSATANGNNLWHTESANRQVYFISSNCHDRRIGSSSENVFSTKNRKEWEEWKVVERESGTTNQYTVFNKKHKKFLGSAPNGDVFVNNEAGDWEMWRMGESPSGGIFLVSSMHNRLLTCNDCGNLYTRCEDGKVDGWTSWNLEPCMPPSISEGQILKYTALGVTGAVTLALSIAMPFVAVGAIGAMGFTEGGIVAGSTAAAMMSAEALAAGGGVVAGGTVATLQSIGVVGLGLAGTSAAVGAGAIVGGTLMGASVGLVDHLSTNNDAAVSVERMDDIDDSASISFSWASFRPFCAWRTW